MKKNLFKNLFILDLANNHFGDLIHTKKIISSFAKIIKLNKINATIKFQFRDLDSYIHPKFINSDDKYVRRFLDTRFSEENFKKIFTILKNNNIKTSCTPFDEKSVEKIEKMKFDFLKIASVSSQDFNLLERTCYNKIPKIISTGGLTLAEIDKIHSFFSKKQQQFALMHCVAIYPTQNNDLNIQFIKNLKDRYPNIPIGWSTHEYPNELLPAVIAKSCGAEIFERHIGIYSKKYKLNNYSSTPLLFEEWVKSLKNAEKIFGDYYKPSIQKEIKTLNSLQRGVYASREIKKGEILEFNKNISLCFPLCKKQLTAAEFKNKQMISMQNIKSNEAINKKIIKVNPDFTKEVLVRGFVHKAKAMLNYSKIKVKEKFEMEISHHEGIENFKKVGCFLLNLLNKKYAKKILIMLPMQKHPLHKHKIKVESFIISFGSLYLKDNKKTYVLTAGDIVHLKKNKWHSFKAGSQGCIFEEISTTSYKEDTIYFNKKINSLLRSDRKTIINKWF